MSNNYSRSITWTCHIVCFNTKNFLNACNYRLPLNKGRCLKVLLLHKSSMTDSQNFPIKSQQLSYTSSAQEKRSSFLYEIRSFPHKISKQGLSYFDRFTDFFNTC